MESKGLGESNSGLELTIAAAPAGIDLNSLFGSNDGGNESSEENATAELALLNTINHVPHGEEKANGVDVVDGDAAGGGSLIVTRKHYRKLSKEQNDELEAAFQQENFIDKRTKEALAERLKITPEQVNVWFLNRRSRLKKQKNEEAYIQYKQQVEELTKKKGRLQHKITKLKKRNKELKKKLKEATSTPKAAPPPQPSPSVMVLPLSPGLSPLAGLCPPGFEGKLTDMAAAAALSTQQVTATAAALALPSPSAPPVPPSGGGSSV